LTLLTCNPTSRKTLTLPQPTFPSETKRIRALASNSSCRFKYTGHALDEMRKDKIERPDVEHALKLARVVRVEQIGFEDTWNCVGSDIDGRKIEVVAVVYEDRILVKIITAWEK